MNAGNLNLPNAVSALRILAVPVLALLAFRGAGLAFTILLAASLLLDALDGYLARRLNQQTPLGAQLDSWGDFLTVLVYPGAALWLQPVLLKHNALWVTLAFLAYLSPIALGFLKYGRLTSYHTRLMSLCAYLMGAAAVAFFAGWSDLPLRGACLVLVAAAAEEVLITATLPVWQANVRDLKHALALRSAMTTATVAGR
ncbi:MAG TPA: CDP-alcohol phosphatidyltransferase family protein [Steroidobacteraceae bacterium]|nr:CDP-alcohol phosphatidyltransferase family protein [Gammaproteobacteria bacterium]HEV2286388.1 CDP-alcohol phosphatidyltransferase family protein [Steroidobacteraceae bacterium]